MRDYIAMALIIAMPWVFAGAITFAAAASIKREG